MQASERQDRLRIYSFVSGRLCDASGRGMARRAWSGSVPRRCPNDSGTVGGEPVGSAFGRKPGSASHPAPIPADVVYGSS